MQQDWYDQSNSNSVWRSRSERYYKYFSDKIWVPVLSCVVTVTSGSSVRILFFVIFMFAAAFLSTRLLDATVSTIVENPTGSILQTTKTVHIQPNINPLISKKPSKDQTTETSHTESTITQVISKNTPKKIEIPLQCLSGNLNKTCPTDYYPKRFKQQDHEYSSDSPHECPEYFRWIHEDLKPWKETGISEETVLSAKKTANFRLVILNGRAYVETYEKSFQSRDVFTLWGILQLLRRYPGKIPDLDLMFDCVDWPVILKKYYSGPNAVAPPPPLFRYCSDDSTLDIPFPDWSFWGWPEINIKPWGSLLKELEEGNMRSKWIDREPYAYWKGNPLVAETRMDLLKCNVSDEHDWNARVYSQDWFKESQQGYKQSDLASQCVHRYKIYIEGSAWSVSDKYILACDSVTFVVKPRYYDFFTRGLMPVHHYWPIKEDDKCRSIKFAVDWGNSHKQKAQEIGKAASKFIQEDLKMDKVYDYMFHLLTEYSKLLKYKPKIPEKAVELCSESMVCGSQGFEKQFMMDSMIKGPEPVNPCIMQPPYEPQTLKSLIKRKTNSLLQVEKWEKGYFESLNKTP